MRASRHSTAAWVAQPATRVDTTCWQLFRPDINTPIFIFFVAELMSNYLTTDGLKIFSLLPEAPGGVKPVAFATSATWLIRHCQQIHTFEHNICQRQVARKTQSSTSWRPIINGTKANVVLEKHTTKQKKTCKQREIKRQSLQKKKTKVENCSYARQ